jgi:hypothetical protein
MGIIWTQNGTVPVNVEFEYHNQLNQRQNRGMSDAIILSELKKCSLGTLIAGVLLRWLSGFRRDKPTSDLRSE